jgi:hypothetical protein
MSHIVHSGVSGARIIEALFFMLGWDQYVIYKKCARTHYAETSLHNFSCSGGTGTDSTKIALGHVTPNLCFCISVGSAGHVVHSGASEV